MGRKFDLTSNIPEEVLKEELETLASLGDDKPVDGEAGEYTVQSIWRTLSEKGDIIIIIDKVDEIRLRRQISSIKAKEHYKLREAGIPTDNDTIEFIIHKDKELDEKNLIKMQLFLKKKPTIKLHKFIIPKE